MKQITFSNNNIINKKTCQQKKLINKLQLLQNPYKNKVSYTQPLMLPELTCKQKISYFFRKIKVNFY